MVFVLRSLSDVCEVEKEVVLQVAYSNPTNNFNNHKNVNFGARFLEAETLSKLLGKLDLTSKSMNYVDSFTKNFPDAVIEVQDCSKYIGNN